MGGRATVNHFTHDVWQSDDSGQTWHQLERPPWSQRDFHAVVHVGRNFLLLFGGASEGDICLNDIWWSVGKDPSVWVDKMPKQILSLVSCSETEASQPEAVAVCTFAMLNGMTIEVDTHKGTNIASVAENICHKLGLDDVQLLGTS